GGRRGRRSRCGPGCSSARRRAGRQQRRPSGGPVGPGSSLRLLLLEELAGAPVAGEVAGAGVGERPVVDAGRSALAGVDDPGPVADGPVVGPLLGPPIRRAHPPDPDRFLVGGGAGAGADPVVVVPHRVHRRPSAADQLDPAATHGAGAELGGGHDPTPHRLRPTAKWWRARPTAVSQPASTCSSRSISTWMAWDISSTSRVWMAAIAVWMASR